MHRLLHTTESAHSECIWNCAWGQTKMDETDYMDVNMEDPESKENQEKSETVKSIIVTCSLDDTIKVWSEDAGELTLTNTYAEHSLGFISVALNSSASLCAATSLDGRLIMWDMRSDQPVHRITDNSVENWTTTFSPDDKYLISGNNQGKINMYNVETGMIDETLDTRGRFILSTAWSHDGKYIATGALDGIVHIFDVQTAKLAHTLEGHAMPTRSLSFSQDNKHLLTASDDGYLKIYSVQCAEIVGTVSGHSSWVLSADFSPNSNQFVSGSADNTVKVWELKDLQCAHTYKDHNSQVWGAKYNKEGSKIVSVSEDACINVYSCPIE